MFKSPAGVLQHSIARVLATTLLCLALIGLLTGASRAGGNHAPATATGTGPSPRAILNSENFQIVGIVEGEVMVIYLDRFSDNAPLTTAQLEVTIDEQVFTAEPKKNGTYEVTSAVLKTPGEHAVLVSVKDGKVLDLLVGSVAIPEVTSVAVVSGNAVWAFFSPHSRILTIGGIALGTLLSIFLAARLTRTVQPVVLATRTRLAHAEVASQQQLKPRVRTRKIGMRTRRREAATVIVLASVAFFGATDAFAGGDASDGHSHGPEAGSAANGNAPQRLPDGTIFLPKPTQRLLEVRTRIMALETATRTTRFQGRIIANPNKSGVVQSTISGRYTAPPDGVPAVGARVKAGDLMGKIAPSFVSKEAVDVGQTLAELDQQIALARSKLARQEQLLRANVIVRVTVDEARIQLDGLVKRRSELLETRVKPEDLRASSDGVIIAARVVNGQVVASADQLFQIVDPSSLFVEALMFDQSQTDQIGDAVAQLSDGRTAKLKFLSRSRSLQQQYALLKFELTTPSADMNVGMPVIVVGSTGKNATGLRLPRAAVAQAPNGQMVVFVHKDAEIFEPRAIRFELFDADTVMVTGGIENGEKIVVQNAPLVNQVR